MENILCQARHAVDALLAQDKKSLYHKIIHLLHNIEGGKCRNKLNSAFEFKANGFHGLFYFLVDRISLHVGHAFV